MLQCTHADEEAEPEPAPPPPAPPAEHPKASTAFDAIDVNADGTISKDEFKAAFLRATVGGGGAASAAPEVGAPVSGHAGGVGESDAEEPAEGSAPTQVVTLQRGGAGQDLGLGLGYDAESDEIVISSITPGSLADQCGLLREYDPVVSINGYPVSRTSDFKALLAAGDSRTIDIEIQLGEDDEEGEEEGEEAGEEAGGRRSTTGRRSWQSRLALLWALPQRRCRRSGFFRSPQPTHP